MDPTDRRRGCGAGYLGWPHQSSAGVAGGPAGPCQPDVETGEREPCLSGQRGPSGGQHFLLDKLGMYVTTLEFRTIKQGEVKIDGGGDACDGTFR